MPGICPRKGGGRLHGGRARIAQRYLQYALCFAGSTRRIYWSVTCLTALGILTAIQALPYKVHARRAHARQRTTGFPAILVRAHGAWEGRRQEGRRGHSLTI